MERTTATSTPKYCCPCLWLDKVYMLCYICTVTCKCIQIWTIQLLIFTEKFSPLPGFEPGTKPICYQLSYPRLDPTLNSSLSLTGTFLIENPDGWKNCDRRPWWISPLLNCGLIVQCWIGTSIFYFWPTKLTATTI